jgi:prolyl oligopeptidase
MTGGPPRGAARRGDDADLHHGIHVPDPYRWLERGDAPEVREWVAAQNQVTRTALDALPSRPDWHEQVSRFLCVPVVHAVQCAGDRLFVLERDEGAPQASLVARSVDDSEAAIVLVDPTAIADDGVAAVDWFSPSPDGELVAFGISEGGTEQSELRIVRTDDGSPCDVRIPHCRASSVAWEPDGSGFFYTRYPAGDAYHRTVHHHTIGDDPADDPVVWAQHPTPETWPTVSMSPDGRWLLVQSSVGWSRTDVQVLDRRHDRWAAVIVGVEATTSLTFVDEDTLVGVTTLDAPRGRVVSISLGGGDLGPGGWRTVVPERETVATGAHADVHGLLVVTSHNGVDTIERWAHDGSGGAELAGLEGGTVLQLSADRAERRVFCVVTGFDQPNAVFLAGRDRIERMHPAKPPSGVPDLTVTHVEYPSADGTLVGLFLIHRADVEPSAETATILTGYGGFAITKTSTWSPAVAAWCESGGQYAIAGLRGGSEHGDAWHQAGRRANKQNVFDDFHAAADWLVGTKRTSRDRLAIAGGSNGGLLVGAALTQRPDLCRAVWCSVPLLDMIRFPQFLIARLWTDEYGDPDVPEEFEWLMSYSPYHRVRDGERYPAVLLTTAEGDSRVDPLHARKMAARLQAAGVGQDERPVLLHQEARAGHGVGKPVAKTADEQADALAFFSWQLGHERSEPGSLRSR